LLHDRDLAQVTGKTLAPLSKRNSRKCILNNERAFFRQAVVEYQPGNAIEEMATIRAASKAERERIVAEEVIATAFEYLRVGYDYRR